MMNCLFDRVFDSEVASLSQTNPKHFSLHVYSLLPRRIGRVRVNFYWSPGCLVMNDDY